MFRTLRFYHSFFKFLSTPSSRRATQDQIHHLWRGGHFYPRPPRGGRPKPFCNLVCRDQFLPTPSARRATPSAARVTGMVQNFYPRPPRGGRLPRSTPTSAGAYFYPRPPRGGRHSGQMCPAQRCTISIHALREEGDTASRPTGAPTGQFLSTPSARRATSAATSPANPRKKFLSTPSARRATRAGAPTPQPARDFYPRPPRGGRLRPAGRGGGRDAFLSTPSARRAT